MRFLMSWGQKIAGCEKMWNNVGSFNRFMDHSGAVVNLLKWNKSILYICCFSHVSYKIQHILIWICAQILVFFTPYDKNFVWYVFRSSSILLLFGFNTLVFSLLAKIFSY